MDGDGRADAIVINNDRQVYVKKSNGVGFGSTVVWLTNIPNDRESKNYFYDVTGPDADGKRRADLIAVNNNGLVVCKATQSDGFAACTNWTANNLFTGARGTYFADYNGDGRVDAIKIETTGTGPRFDVIVGYSTGSSFLSDNRQASNFQSDRGIYFAKLDATNRDYLVTVMENGVWILNSNTGNYYNATNGPFYGLR